MASNTFSTQPIIAPRGRGGYNGPNSSEEDDNMKPIAPMDFGRGSYNKSAGDDEEEDGRGGYN